MAQQLGVSSSNLSEVMNGKSNFSTLAMRKVAKGFRLAPRETEYLCLLVQLDSAPDPEARAFILEQMRALNPNGVPAHDVDVDQFRQMSEWYHSAILELARLNDYDLTADSAANSLGISKLEAEVALDRLSRLQLIAKDAAGQWKRSTEDLSFRPSNTPEALRSFYRQMMEKASDSLDEQSQQERVSGYETMSFAPEALPEARAATHAYFEELVRISKKHPRHSQVYHLLVHLFNLTPSVKGTA